MYFYRLMSKEELKQKKIHNNKNNFSVYVNTHKYKKNRNYVHLFLNAESCFEDFDKALYNNCVIAKFDIPDDILIKYGIHLGEYNLSYNNYNKKYRFLNYRNTADGYSFWLPEIAIEAKDFDYNWLIDVCPTKNENGKYYLKDSFITDDIYYQSIVYDGYLIGYKDENELLEKYKNLIELKKHIINILKTTRIVNINPNDLNRDSMLAYYALANYALINGFIDDQSDLKLILSIKSDKKSINITSETGLETVINKYGNSLNHSFCEKLQTLGIDVDSDILIEKIRLNSKTMIL